MELKVKIKKLSPDAVMLVRRCAVCNKEFAVPPWRIAAKYCSQKCQHEGVKGKSNATCPVCGRDFHCKPYHLRRYKQVCCSRECSLVLRKERMSGEGNHQYGLRGDKNTSFKSGHLLKGNNGLKEILVYVGEWYSRTSYKGRVPLHRLVVEKNWDKYNPDSFDKIDGWHYIKRGYEVHHIDFNHNNNDLSNLALLTKGEHRSLHNKHRNQNRDTNGRYKRNDP